MSYETENRLPPTVSKRQAIEFAELLGYTRSGTYAHLGMPSVTSLSFFDEKSYRSWTTVELRVHPHNGKRGVIVGTRTSVGRSSHDFAMQNYTVKEFKKRFGGTTYRDGGNGEGYDPGPPFPPAASVCVLAMRRLDWNLSRINMYFHKRDPIVVDQSIAKMEATFPVLKEINPDVFIGNMLVPYMTSLMEDYFKSTYIALLRFAAKNREGVLKSVRLRGDQLDQISEQRLTVEEAVAELLPFHLPSNVGQHFKGIDPKLDVLASLRRKTKRERLSLLERLDELVEKRHALIHDMTMDVQLNHKRAEELVFDVTDGMARIYRHVTSHFSWPCEMPISSNFMSRRTWEKLRRGRQASEVFQSGAGSESPK